MSVEPQQEMIAVRMRFSVVGVGTAGQVVDVPAQRAAELVSANAAVFLDPPVVAPIFAEDLLPDATDDKPDTSAPTESGATESAAAVSEEPTNGKNPRTRESRPRSSTSPRDAGGGTSGSADNAGNSKPGEGDIAG